MHRSTLSCASLLLPAFSVAQSLGTKKDVVSPATTTTAPIVQPWDLLQMFVAVAVVAVLLKWVLPKVIAKLGKRISTPVGSSISVEETASFGGGQLQIVKVRSKTLLLSIGSTGVTCLADLTESLSTDQEAKVFFDYLDEAKDKNPTIETASAAAVLMDGGPSEDPSTPRDAPQSELSMEDAIALISAAQSRLTHGSEAQTPEDRWRRLTGS